MHSSPPSVLRACALLSQLSFHCHAARQQLHLYRYASTNVAGKGNPTTAATAASPTPASAKSAVSKAVNEWPTGGKKDDHTPKPLERPIGVTDIPRPGENSGIDARSWRERRDDFLNYDKHLEKRKYLTKEVSKPYFREWSNMRFHKGKTFVAPSRLFRADKALYFPNLQGVTLAMPRDPQDTTGILDGKVSVLSVFSGAWGQEQTESFVENNPELDAVLRNSQVVQKVYLNVEENGMKAGLVRLFMPGLRKKLPEPEHERYFLIRRGLTDQMRNEMGYVNSKVGYVYLVDWKCRVRWAGSGPAGDEERVALVRGVRRLEQDAEHQLEKGRRSVEQKRRDGLVTAQPQISNSAVG